MVGTKARKTLACFAAALTALTFAGCSNPLDTILAGIESPTVEEAKASRLAASTVDLSSAALVTPGFLTVGLPSSAGAPMVSDSSDGTYKGFDVDVASALADTLGLNVTFVQVTNAADAVGTECDIVMNTSSVHASGLVIAGSYAEDATAFFTKGDATATSSDGTLTPVSASDISGKTVGVQSGSSSQQYLQRSDLNAEQSTYSNLNEAFEALESGSVDYVLCNALSGSYLAGIYDDISLVGTLDVPESIGVATANGDSALQTAVQEALSSLNSNGVIGIIRNKWINGMPVLSSTSQVDGITISSGSVVTNTDSEDASVTSDAQDGSTAGANAADIY